MVVVSHDDEKSSTAVLGPGFWNPSVNGELPTAENLDRHVAAPEASRPRDSSLRTRGARAGGKCLSSISLSA